MLLQTTQFYRVIVIISCALNQSKASKIYFLSNVVDFNRFYVQDVQANISANHLSINVLLNIAKDPPSDLYFDIVVDIRNRRTNRFRRLFRAMPMNLCDMSSMIPNWFKIWLKSLLKRGGLDIEKCPIKKGIYEWENISSENFQIPFLVTGSYRTMMLVSLDKGKELLTNLTIFLEIK